MLKNKLILPKVINKNEALNFFNNIDMPYIVDEYTSNKKNNSFKPNLVDLYFLYKIIRLNKRLTSLEFGCGWSSLVIAKALKDNQIQYSKKTLNLRKQNKFELHIYDNYKKYISITKKRMEKYLPKNKNYKFNYSKCTISTHLDCYCTLYEKKLEINPDFIYIDGPSQYGVFENINFDFNTDHDDFMPMSGDVLKYEFFLIPGTIIVIDGRGANANFLLKLLKRKWKYSYNKEVDQHYFILLDDSFGKHSDNLINFWKSN